MTAATASRRQGPRPPDFTAFAVHPDSIYAAHDGEAAELAALAAEEVRCYRVTAALLEAAAREGRNPLQGGGRRSYTAGQLEELREAAAEARGRAAAMLSECADAFGEGDAGRIAAYAQAREAEAVKGATPQAEQIALLF